MKLKLLFTICCLTIVFTTNNIKVVKAEENVAIVSIFAYDGNNTDSSSGFMNFYGHAFFTIKNVSNFPLKIGKMTIQSYETISLGTWGNKNLHVGLWYNLESYFAQNNTYNGSVSLSETINNSKLSSLNELINNNDAWRPLFNCSSFATKVWNSISSRNVDAGFINTPAHLKSSIKNYDYTINQTIPYNSNIGYYENDNFVKIDMNSITNITNMLNPCSFN